MAIEGRTGKLLQSSVEFEWAIKDIFSYTDKDESLLSPYFHVAGFLWYLAFQFHPSSQYIPEEYSLYLHFKNDQAVLKTMIYSLGVKNVDGITVNVGSEISCLFNHTKPSTENGYRYFLARSELLDRKHELAPSGVLTLTCTFRHNNREELIPPISKSLTSLSEDLLSMFTSKRGCDATVNVQGEEFAVHKSILMSRSPVLKVVFEADMEKKMTGNVVIEDCTPKVFQDFLMYLYSGIFKYSANDVFQLYYIADKYDVKELMSDCVDYLTRNLSIDNVLDAIIIGHHFDKADLKRKGQEFFNEHFAKIVLTTKWNSLVKDNYALFDEILKNFSESMETKTSQVSPTSRNPKQVNTVAVICIIAILFIAFILLFSIL